MAQQEGLTVEVRVKGQALLVYPDNEADSDDSTTKNFFLEAKAGDTYKLFLSCNESLFEGREALGMKVVIDGGKVDESSFDLECDFPLVVAGPREAYLRAWKTHPLMFANIQTGKLPPQKIFF